MGHNPSVCNNKRVFQDYTGAENTPLPQWSALLRGLFTEGNWGEGNRLAFGKEISTVWRTTESMRGLNVTYLHKSPLNVTASDMLSVFQAQLDNYCLCVQDITFCVFICACDHRRSAAGASGNAISCLFALLMQENEWRIWCLWLTEKRQDSDQSRSHGSRHRITSDSRTTFDCSYFLPLLPSSASFAATRSILSSSTHASLAHTPLPLPLRGGTAVSEQARPLCGADRALIWRLMLWERLIKWDRWEGGRPYRGKWKHLNSGG